MTYLSGFHAIEERIKSGLSCGALLVAKPGPRAREIVALAIERKITVNRAGTAELDRLSGDHRGILLEVDDPLRETGTHISLEGFIASLGDRKDALVVILDEITDPHNYGAILRSCDQFGADIVITRKRRIAKYADAISKTSAGASAWVPTAEAPNLPRAVEILKEKGFWVYGADMEGEPGWDKDLRGRTAIILGGEGTGISRILKESCDALISIPSLGKLDSLNVSVAAGVLFYEVMRQRKTLNPKSK
ncbi:MAG: 23S rRNA (guanosine(2251)-2'-O)-methyltransferase RlmB [Treponema sp.]|jgi:23S rRNA (guanosine2251-2'-O)-methyltransferase|nr:23S rRNA (guanosine(2251)-2'-O)-methyltransferase RlmB [Treponema sp.]